MINYIGMKIMFMKLKIEFYKMFTNADDILKFFLALVDSCKDMTGDALREEFISALAQKVHEDTHKEKNPKVVK